MTQKVKLTPTGARMLVSAEPLPMHGYSRPSVYPQQCVAKQSGALRSLDMLSYMSALCAVSSTRLGVLDGHLRGEGHRRATAAGTDARHHSADGVLQSKFGRLLSCTGKTEKRNHREEQDCMIRECNSAPRRSWLLHDDYD